MRVNAVSFGEVKCTPVKNQLKKDATPCSVTTARIPIPLLGKVEEELKWMEEGKIIQAVTEPAEWVAPIIPVIRPNGTIRICVETQPGGEKRTLRDPNRGRCDSSAEGPISLLQARCCLRVLADTSRSRDCEADHIHNPIRQILLHLASVRLQRYFRGSWMRSHLSSTASSATLTTYSVIQRQQKSTLSSWPRSRRDFKTSVYS